jgi:hypothetical protein
VPRYFDIEEEIRKKRKNALETFKSIKIQKKVTQNMDYLY